MNMGNVKKESKKLKLNESHVIYNFNLNDDFSRYSTLVKDDFKIAKGFFPLLKLSILPTVKPKEIFIMGDLIPYGVLKNCNSEYDINRYSIYIMATYPSNFNNEDIYVEDIYREINWENIPPKHRHFRYHKDKEILCTHHLLGEINGIPKSERSIAILFSAWKLYIQYKKFQRTNEWVLPDLLHGTEAIKELKQMGSYYGN